MAEKRSESLERVSGAKCTNRTPSDTLRFSSVVTEPETGDQSGYVIALVSGPTGWSGSAQKAAGELEFPIRMAHVALDTATGSLSFIIPRGPDSTRFEGTFSCDSIWGELRSYAAVPAKVVVMRRVP
jgi:hypothetical protein